MSRVRVSRAGPIGIIHDAAAYPDFDPRWLDPEILRAEGARPHTVTGRGSVLMVDRGGETWVYRHYHRGGVVSRFVYDRYLWTGLERSRPFREWRLLESMQAGNLPAPRPVAARAVREGPFYRADILTVLLPDTRPLSTLLAESAVPVEIWPKIGSMVRRFHDAGVDHPDLTAHNILVEDGGRVFLVDFDNARKRPPGPWREAGMSRLQRSLRKVAVETGSRFDVGAWRALVADYGA